MSAPTVRLTRKKLACDLVEGDVFAAGLIDGSKYRVTLYTVTQVYPSRPSDETITLQLTYAYDDEPGTRTIGIGRMECVTLV